MSNRMWIMGGVVLAAALIWLLWWSSERSADAAAGGVVTVSAPAVPGPPAPPAPSAPARAAPALPRALIEHVRRAYPLLRDVDVGCDARGCAITATIPPPTGEAFLKKRQEMLVGGLAELVQAHGYRMIGPVQMDEVDDNLFHIRASIVAQPRTG